MASRFSLPMCCVHCTVRFLRQQCWLFPLCSFVEPTAPSLDTNLADQMMFQQSTKLPDALHTHQSKDGNAPFLDYKRLELFNGNNRDKQKEL